MFKKKYHVAAIHPKYGETYWGREFVTFFFAEQWARGMNDYYAKHYAQDIRAGMQVSKWVVRDI